MEFTVAGIYFFDRPYGPFVVQTVGLGVISVVVVKTGAYEEWTKRSIFLTTFIILIIEYKRKKAH